MSVVLPTAVETRFLKEAGLGDDLCLSEIKLGRNNQVFHVSDDSGCQVILKRYFQHPNDNRDRLLHEWSFLEYAGEVAESYTPRPIACSFEDRFAIIESVPGEAFVSVSPGDIENAVQFFTQLNQSEGRELAENLPLAADACFRTEDHCQLLQQRVNRFSQLPDGDSITKQVKDFVEDELIPNAQKVFAMAERNSDQSINLPRVISPSDFGFHNAIKRPDGQPVCFIDFEYAGWDGPVKMMCDFLSQPDFPVPPESEAALMNAYHQIHGNSATQANLDRQLPVMKALHALKWVCILLNGFFDADLKRRKFAGDLSGMDEVLKRTLRYFEQVACPRLKVIN